MSKCRINKYKAGFGTTFTTPSTNSKSENGTLDISLAAKLAAREAQDSQLWTPQNTLTVKKESKPTRGKDIDTILNGSF